VETDSSHRAWVSDFRLDRFEVTVGRFRKFVAAWNAGYRPAAGTGKHEHLNAGAGLADASGTTQYEQGWQSDWNAHVAPTNTNLTTACDTSFLTWTSSPGANENRPMGCANWYEAEAFCIWDGGFLPSEAEWHYAGSGGDEQRVYPWSNPPSSTLVDCTYANTYTSGYCANPAGPNDVGSESRRGDSKYGQADLWGNLQEWQLDFYSASLPATCRDCAYLRTTTTKVSGGSCFDCGPGSIQSHAGTYGPTDRNRGTGFRCARPPVGCSSDLQTDPQNCGHCGHSCLGGSCALGECQPVIVATGQKNPQQMAVNGTHVFWANYGDDTTGAGGGVMRAPIAGGAAIPVVTGEKAWGIALDDGHAYFTSSLGGGALREVPLAGGSAQTVVSASSPGALLANATDAFWLDGGTSSLKKAALAGGMVTTLAAASVQGYVAFGSTTIFYVTSTTVYSVPLAGGPSVPVATGQTNAYGVATSPRELVWTNLTNSGTVTKAALNGSNPVVLASGRAGPQTVTLDDNRVYWTENGLAGGGTSALAMVPLVGGSVTVLASWPREAVGIAANVIVDAKALYWNVSDGSVYMLAKP
jgi:formylglycine-generating enzyme required for sulfatase activity